jgi:hypothetical protein
MGGGSMYHTAGYWENASSNKSETFQTFPFYKVQKRSRAYNKQVP